ncbi:MAG: transposase [Deltaproteobacteria bacterium]|nr:transposase [Deltaproteobacteria bacterium]
MNETKREVERRRLIEETLDESYGECLLKRQEIARIVESALFYFNGERYFLHSWVVMPNHVHVLVTPMGINIMSAIVHSWKSFTAKEANRLLGRKGVFWQEEYFDRVIRNETHFRAVVEYIEYNPVRAGLCALITDWKFGSFLGARASRPL